MEATATRSHIPIPVPQGLLALVAFLVVMAALTSAYASTLTPTTLVIDGQTRRVRTHQETVGALLADVGLTLWPEDRVIPAELETSLEAVDYVRVERARPVSIRADDHSVTFYTHASSVEEFLREIQVSVGPHDELTVEGEFLPAVNVNPKTAPAPVHVTVRRAVPFTLHEDGQQTTLYTTAPTIGEALRRAGVTLYIADGVEPPLGEWLEAGMHVTIDRSTPVAVDTDGRTLRTRTHRERVDEVLADLNIVLTGQDYTVPALDAPLGADAIIRVMRVSERFEITQDPIPYESLIHPDPDLEIDYTRLIQEGARGILERRTRVIYEDGNEVNRIIENEYVVVPPTPKITGYGTQIVIRTLNTPSGPVQYWRKVRMLATSYSASTAGTPKTSPWYGHTRTGEKMRFGIVAVDPRYIDLRSNVYVENYGVGYAGDTGGAIKGKRIDLGYDDDNLVLWYRWVDVYLLTPVPDSVNYVLGP